MDFNFSDILVLNVYLKGFHMLRTCVVGMLILFVGCVSQAWSEAFPGAQGYGAVATGGRGGKVVFVTSTDDNPKNPAPGTLRWACEKLNGPRIVVFRTGGVILLNRPLTVKSGDLTLAAQTAPGDGICLAGSPLRINGSNVILRGLRIRPGDGAGTKGSNRDCLQISGNVQKVIVDHCSMTWATDETLDISTWPHVKDAKLRDITVQWCVIGQALNNSIHPEGAHSAGVLIWGQDIDRVSLHHNLIASNGIRNPRIAGNVKVQIINNLMYNWGKQGTNLSVIGAHQDKWGSVTPGVNPVVDLQVGLFGNCWLPGPDTDMNRHPIIVQKMPKNPHCAFMSDNLLLTDFNPKNAKTKHKDLINKTKCVAPQGLHIKPFEVNVQPAASVLSTVLANCGAMNPQRDQIDKQIIAGIKNLTGKIIDSPKDVGGYPDYRKGQSPIDTDQDGMPDTWETTHQLDPKTSDANGRKIDADYDNIEVYINSLIQMQSSDSAM